MQPDTSNEGADRTAEISGFYEAAACGLADAETGWSDSNTLPVPESWLWTTGIVRLRVGAEADVTISDATRVIDRSTDRGADDPPGRDTVSIVNGVPVVRHLRGEDSMTYTHGHHESVLRSHKWRTVDNSAAYLTPHLTRGTSVLDLGCGPGTITADIGRRVAPGRVLGIDMSADVIEEARRDAGAGPNVEFAVGDLYALDIDDDTFDIVHAHQVLQHLADPVGALRQMRRVCKPGGLVAARDGDYGGFRWYPDEPAIDRWLALYRKVARRNAGEPDAGRFLLAWAHSAGFDDVLPGASVWCFATPDDRAWWGGLWADRMTDSAIARQAVAEGLATETELREIAEGWRRWATHPDGWYAVLHGEILCRA